MKILVIQLTRLGDILCTVPTLSALRRDHPKAEIHFMVRKRYASAAKLAPYYDHLWQFDTQKIIGGLITEEAAIIDSLEKLKIFIQELRQEKFDRVINLSFSPSSSFVAHLVAQDKISVEGYSRTPDFYLSLPDEASLYFRAQVGLDRSNRIHIIDLLAWVAGTKLKERDLYLTSNDQKREGIVCHVGASVNEKTWPEASWVLFLTQLLNGDSENSVTLIGSQDEIERGENICLQVGSPRLINRVGKTTLEELKNILKNSSLFIGCDSGPLHLASLVQCPTLNLSLGDVRFWETGPTAKGARVLCNQNPDHLMSETVLFHTKDILAGAHHHSGIAVCVSRHGVRYDEYHLDPRFDAWGTVNWMYFGGAKPIFKGDLPQALAHMSEVCEIALQQIDALQRNPEKKEIIQILDSLDDVLELIRKNIKPLAPLIDEYRTAKENIPPADAGEIFDQTRKCYLKLKVRVNTLSIERLNHDEHVISKDLV